MELSRIFNSKLTINRILLFMSGLYHSGKITELSSFIVWELKYVCSLFRKHQILEFIDSTPLMILKEFDEALKIESDNFRISRSIINWSLVFIDSSKDYWGTLHKDTSTLYHYSAEGELVKSFKLEGEILGIYISKANNVFCCAGGILYKLAAGETSFTEVMAFSSSQSYFREEAFTESPEGELFIGEYANIFNGKKWEFVGYIYHSMDEGSTWRKIDFLKKEGINKHIHILKWSKVINGLILTDGDNQKNIWINTSIRQFADASLSLNSGWKKLNRNHIEKGGHTGIVELNDKILFGSDYNGGTNFLISTSDMIHFDEKVLPNPYRRAIFKRMKIRINENNDLEVWSVIEFRHSSRVKSLVMMSTDAGNTWNKIIEYDGTQFEVFIMSDSLEIARELYLIIIDENQKTAKTIYVHS